MKTRTMAAAVLALGLAVAAGCGKEKSERSPVMPGVPEVRMIRTSGVWSAVEWYIDEDHALVHGGAKLAPTGVAGISRDSGPALDSALGRNIGAFVVDAPTQWNEQIKAAAHQMVQKIESRGQGFFLRVRSAPVGGRGFPFQARNTVELRTLRGAQGGQVTLAVDASGQNFPLGGATYAEEFKAHIFDLDADAMIDVTDKVEPAPQQARPDRVVFDVSQALAAAPENGFLVISAKFNASTMYGLPTPLTDPTLVSAFGDFVDEIAETFAVKSLRGLIVFPDYQPVEIGFSDTIYPDYSADGEALDAYRQWLIQGFGDVVRFNREVGRNYDAFTKVEWETPPEPNLAAEALKHNTFGLYDDPGQRMALDRLQRDFHLYHHSSAYAELALALQRRFNRLPVLASLRIGFPGGDLPVITRYLLNQGLDGIAARIEADLAALDKWDSAPIISMLDEVQKGTKRTKAWIISEAQWKGRAPEGNQPVRFFELLAGSGAKGFFIAGPGLNTTATLTLLGKETERLTKHAVSVRPADILARKKPEGEDALPPESERAALARDQLKPEAEPAEPASAITPDHAPVPDSAPTPDHTPSATEPMPPAEPASAITPDHAPVPDSAPTPDHTPPAEPEAGDIEAGPEGAPENASAATD